MSKHTHTATIEGHTVTRTSANRVYTHAIIHRYNVADARAAAEASARGTFKMNLSYTKKMAAGGIYRSTFANGLPFTAHITADEQARSQAILDKGVEGAVAERLAEFDARTHIMSADGIHAYGAAAWASRLDLAQKACKGLDVIVEATVVSK